MAWSCSWLTMPLGAAAPPSPAPAAELPAGVEATFFAQPPAMANANTSTIRPKTPNFLMTSPCCYTCAKLFLNLNRPSDL